MKTRTPILHALLLLVLAFTALSSPSLSEATTLGMMTVKMPLYLHGSDGDPIIEISDVPFVSAYAAPEATYAAITKPFTPPTDGSWKDKEDVNIASVYGIKVEATDAGEGDVSHLVITVNASAAKAPEGYPFTVQQVTDAVVTCVRLMTPIRPADEQKVTVKVLEPGKKK
ncbi:hypothetical protein [Roseimicrobium gellanilyticum]|nr:hypothetical protein [Roseimicrobium gellanilyticum]